MRNKSILFYIIALIFSHNSCSSSNNQEYIYFGGILDSINAHLSSPKELKKIQMIELEKYKVRKDLKYLVSSKYIELFLVNTNTDEEKIKQIPLVVELLKLNNDRYKFITTVCYFNLSSQFEKSSPRLSMEYINKAISLDEKSEQKFFLAHLLSFKGKLFYNKKDFINASIYFNQAIKIYKKDQILYISSMYNNIGLCNANLGNLSKAISNAQKAMALLNSKKELNNQEIDFLFNIKGNLGTYYLKLKKYEIAEIFLVQEVNFRKKKQNYSAIIQECQDLLVLFNETNQADKRDTLISFLDSIQPYVKSYPENIMLSNTLYQYYSKQGTPEVIIPILANLYNLYHAQMQQREDQSNMVSDILNSKTIESIKQENRYKQDVQNRNIYILIIAIFLILASLGIIILVLKVKNLRNNKLYLEQKSDFEQRISCLKEKISNLYLNLNLKVENEKKFLDSVKKVKKSKNIDVESSLNELYFRIDNLIQIDKKNNYIIEECFSENELYIKRLSNICPILSEQELKLCTYFRLDLSAKEIALLENISPGSVRVYKSKIKTKIGLSKEMAISSFLNNI